MFQHIAHALAVFIIGNVLFLLILHSADKQCKRDKLQTGTYRLRKWKYFFSYHKRKDGEMTKSLFWLNVLLYISVLTFVPLWVVFVVMQSWILAVIVLCVAWIPMILCCVVVFIVTYHVLRAEKAKKQAQPPAKKISTYIPPRAWQTEASEDIVEEEKKKNLWD